MEIFNGVGAKLIQANSFVVINCDSLYTIKEPTQIIISFFLHLCLNNSMIWDENDIYGKR